MKRDWMMGPVQSLATRRRGPFDCQLYRRSRLLARHLHALGAHLKDADHVPVVLLLLNGELALHDDLVRAIADGLALRAVHHDRVLDLRRLAEAAGEEARNQGK